MEIFPYLTTVLLTLLVLHWSVRNVDRERGTPVFGLFRYRDQPRRRTKRENTDTPSSDR